MKQSETMCPLLAAAYMITEDKQFFSTACKPRHCMWAMRKTAMGEDGQYRTVGYRCAVANGSDRYVEIEEGE